MSQCYNTIEINANANDVWNVISDFHNMSWADNIIHSLQKVGDKTAMEVGAKRILNDVFHETLIKFDAENQSFSYRIDDGPGPVASDAVKNYVGVVKVSNQHSMCLVEWSSTYDSPNNDEVADFCNPIYQGLLHALKKTCE